MFSFCKKRSSKIIFYPTIPGVEKETPIVPASHLPPEWWVNLNYNYNINLDENGVAYGTCTVKKCPGIIDIIKTGYIIPLWTNLTIKHKDDTVQFKTDNDDLFKFYDIHTNDQLIDYLPKFAKTDKLKVIQAETPWTAKVDKDIDFLVTHPFFHFNEYLEHIPGKYPPFTKPDLNLFMYLKKEGEFTIKKGTPMVTIVPIRREKFKMSIKHISEEIYSHAKSSMWVVSQSSFNSGGTSLECRKKGVSMCPWHNK